MNIVHTVVGADISDHACNLRITEKIKELKKIISEEVMPRKGNVCFYTRNEGFG